MSILIIRDFFISFHYIHYFLTFMLLWLVFVIYNLFISEHRNIPGPIISQIFPLYDLYFMAKGDFHLHATELHNTYGPVVRIAFNRVCVNDIDAWKKIHNNYKFAKTDFYDHMRTVGWSMISIKDRALHSSRRRTVAKAFSEANILMLESTVRESGVNVLVEKIKNTKRPLDMSKEFLYLAYDVIGKLVFSKEFNLLKGQNLMILPWIRNLLAFVVLNAVFPPIRIIGNPYYRKLAYMAKESILQRKQQLKDNEKVPNDLLNALIEAKDPDTGLPISMLDLMEECAELLLGGSDTTGNTLTWTLYLILKHPEVKQKLINEIETQFPDKNEKVNYKMISKQLPYFQNVLKEVLRLYPVASHPMLRTTPKDGLTVNQVFIPKNTEVISNCYALHHSNDYWDQPEIFNPDRFNQPQKNNLNAYLPFSSGPRACVGRNLANLELYSTIVELFRNFNMSLINKEELVPTCYIILFPKGHAPFWVKFEEKN